jgi:hypothetical protein
LELWYSFAAGSSWTAADFWLEGWINFFPNLEDCYFSPFTGGLDGCRFDPDRHLIMPQKAFGTF